MTTLKDLRTTNDRFTRTLDHIAALAESVGINPEIDELGSAPSDGYTAVWRVWDVGSGRSVRVFTYLDDTPVNRLGVCGDLEDDYDGDQVDSLVAALAAGRDLLGRLDSHHQP